MKTRSDTTTGVMGSVTQAKKVQLCVLCGEHAATKGEGDHLPPQCIYPKPRPSNIPWNKVPACIPCNNGGSKDDEQFKLIIGISTGEFRSDSQSVIEAMGRTMRTNHRLAKKVLRDYTRGYAKRNGSAILEPVVAVQFEREAYVRVIRRMVRGLYWQQTNAILPKDAEIRVIEPESVTPELGPQISALLRDADRVELNGGTFVYKFVISEDQDSFWAMQFFGKHLVFAFAFQPES
ncbi:HNH endonuclease [Pseudomonas asiatica]|uniref:HNH endonuclease n=1 Tax=Pseudomonas asiatica TaxID=2219225 RepID=UPI0023656C0D|nr:hypothetical protein [Pseudomonas asiatica]MDD1979990.1 hypothetical protein [Pseudomonas asiatica]